MQVENCRRERWDVEDADFENDIREELNDKTLNKEYKGC